MKMDDEEHEHDAVKKELSALMEITLRLEDELNRVISGHKT